MAGTEKFVYRFGAGKADGAAEMKNLLGGKGANLAEMSNIGLPVPPGFTITTEVCNDLLREGKKLPSRAEGASRRSVIYIGKTVGATLETPKIPFSFRCAPEQGVHAWHDGYDPEPWA